MISQDEIDSLRNALSYGLEHGFGTLIVKLPALKYLFDVESENVRLRAAIRYVAGSFAQVPLDKTVPPIVLHDCKRKLEEALNP